ncbi:deoxyribonuclease-2-alpha-like [Scleropages formosus]|uniref:Deoxyribonuclease-2-alpha n=1 Tax=Scleropages formosus TaxID=113540 RepID=A0A8C9SRH8_SCLFO|nr:deoxyribonuclease-2-alpha-like [Scleropages formosus]
MLWFMTPLALVLLLLGVLRAPPGGSAALPGISCYSDHGDPTDWFHLYKLPRLAHQLRGDGLQYLLMGPGSEGWAPGAVEVNDSAGALGRTVGQLYQQREADEIAYILYNDQKPKEEGSGFAVQHEKGHTKGVVLLDKTQGFWLVHSTPHFPPPKDEGEFAYPSTGEKNGQNFLCVTYPLERFQTIGEQLSINEPLIYDCSVPDSMASSLPSLAALCGKSWSEGSNASLPLSDPLSLVPSNRSVELASLAGTAFVSFAKGSSFENDLYHSWVAPALQSDLLVQFWHESAGVLPSDCSQNWEVLNVKTISLGSADEFSTTKDHSKWAVGTEDASGSWICVGDINRNEAEEKRGGGTVCHSNSAVWKAYRTAVVEYYPCEG